MVEMRGTQADPAARLLLLSRELSCKLVQRPARRSSANGWPERVTEPLTWTSKKPVESTECTGQAARSCVLSLDSHAALWPTTNRRKASEFCMNFDPCRLTPLFGPAAAAPA